MSASQAMPCPSESKKSKRSRFPPGFKRAAGQSPPALHVGIASDASGGSSVKKAAAEAAALSGERRSFAAESAAHLPRGSLLDSLVLWQTLLASLACRWGCRAGRDSANSTPPECAVAPAVRGGGGL